MYESLSTSSLVVVITLFSSDATKLRSNVEQVEPKNTFITVEYWNVTVINYFFKLKVSIELNSIEC